MMEKVRNPRKKQKKNQIEMMTMMMDYLQQQIRLIQIKGQDGKSKLNRNQVDKGTKVFVLRKIEHWENAKFQLNFELTFNYI